MKNIDHFDNSFSRETQFTTFNLMNTFIFLSFIAITAITTSLCQAAITANITQKKSGRSISVEIKKLTENILTFKTKNGKIYNIQTNELTEKSLTNIKKILDEEDSKFKKINAKINGAISEPLFEGNTPLWKQQAEDIAQRLGWPKESQTETSSSYRYYPPRNYQFLGAHPYSATLYGGQKGIASHLSLVFSNKGDFGSRAGFGEDHFNNQNKDTPPVTNLNEAIALDAKLISEKLTGALGKPTHQYYGEKEDRRKVIRWDIGEQAFLLSQKKDEYTSLLIISKKNADLKGKVHFVKDSDLKKIQLKNVISKKNGDFTIHNIPMVNQGPKGYCAPATFERAMRYMLVPADMYLLATAATSPKGGTNVRALAESCKRIIRSKARRIRELNLEKKLKMRRIKTYINKGVPILWCMRSLDKYNSIANSRTNKRKQLKPKDFLAWKEEIAKEAEREAPKMKNQNEKYHICMIIGYNEQTNELAVSDSWGPRYELRWIHLDIAKAVTSPGGFVIDF